MRAVSMQCWLAKLVIIVVLAGVAGTGATAQSDDLASLNLRVSELYSVGVYNDSIVIENGVARFREKTVLADTARILSLLVIPL